MKEKDSIKKANRIIKNINKEISDLIELTLIETSKNLKRLQTNSLEDYKESFEEIKKNFHSYYSLISSLMEYDKNIEKALSHLTGLLNNVYRELEKRKI